MDMLEDPRGLRPLPALNDAKSESGLRTGLKNWHVVMMWTVILLAAAAARVTTWWDVFSPDGIRFMADTDPHYHALRALRIVENYPQIPWSDPAINHPWGAVILWPPLFDFLIAAPAKLLGGGLQTVEQVAVWVPLVLGLVTLMLVGAIGTTLGDRYVGMSAAALLAVLPANIQFTILGRPDQHAMELVASCWVFLAFVYSWRKAATWTRATVLGLGIAVSFWNWQGSGFYLILLASFTGLWHLIECGEQEARHPALVLGRGTLVGVALLGMSVALFTPNGFRAMHIMGVSAFHVVLVGITAAFAWILIWLVSTRKSKPSLPRRLVEIIVSSLVPLVSAVVLVPGFRESVDRGLAALTAANAWYAVIHEFSPLLLGGTWPVTDEMASMFRHFGMLLIVAPLCVPVLVRGWRQRPETRPQMLFILYWGSVLMTLTLLRVRFNLYAVIPLALWLGLAFQDLARWLRRRSPAWGGALGFYVTALVAVLVIVPAVSFLAPGTFQEPPTVTMSRPLLRWLRGAPTAVPGHEGVLTPWSLGHAVLYYSRKPVVTTPFGTDGGLGAMEDSARFFLASNPDAAEFLLAQRRIGFLLLSNPLDEVLTLYPFAGSTVPSPVRFEPDPVSGGKFLVEKSFSLLLVSRLYFQDGTVEPSFQLPALGGYRLLFETASVAGASSLAQTKIKLFGVVRGATLVIAHAQPGSKVSATVPIVTNQGRPFVWTTVARSDSTGRASARIPYATGENGMVRALPYTVSDGKRTTELALGESEVVGGATIVVNLSAPGRLVIPAR